MSGSGKYNSVGGIGELLVILNLAELGAVGSGALITTTDLGAKLEMSQQSASRYLKWLEEAGLITRTRCKRNKSFIVITEEGSQALRQLATDILKALDGGGENDRV